jgi:ATP-dependent Lon protease
MIDREALLAELRQVFDARTAEVLLGALDRVVAQVRAAGVTREDFGELTHIVGELAEAQRRTEQRIEELAEAQRRTEQRIEELAEAQRRTEQRIEELAEAQQRSEERLSRLEETVAALAEAQRRTEQRIEELAEAQQRSEERLSRLEETVAALAEAQRRTEQRIEELAEAQRRTEHEIGVLVQAVQRLSDGQQRIWDKLGGLEGRMLELDYREKAPAYFSRLLRKTRVIPRDSLEEALEAYLSVEELHDVLLTDVIVSGQPRQRPELQEVWLALEISVMVDETDVTRAGRRADLLRRAGYRAIPVVAGANITREAQLEVRRQSVLMLQDGRELFWDEALTRWGA